MLINYTALNKTVKSFLITIYLIVSSSPLLFCVLILAKPYASEYFAVDCLSTLTRFFIFLDKVTNLFTDFLLKLRLMFMFLSGRC